MEVKPMSTYMNLLNDWGFKYVFSKEKYLIHFLNRLFEGKETIESIDYLPTEQLGKSENDRKAIFDVYCRNDRGELILLEMQNISQTYFEDRSLYYATFLIQHEAVKGEWDYCLEKVYVIGILNFVPDALQTNDGQYIEQACLMYDRLRKPMTDKLNFIYVILPKFVKVPDELANDLERWLYVLRHSKKLELQPEELKKNTFNELFEEIKVKQLKGNNMENYVKSELKYEDLRNFTSYAEKKGHEVGVLEGKQLELERVVKNCISKGMSYAAISEITGLSEKEIQEWVR